MVHIPVRSSYQRLVASAGAGYEAQKPGRLFHLLPLQDGLQVPEAPERNRHAHRLLATALISPQMPKWLRTELYFWG